MPPRAAVKPPFARVAAKANLPQLVLFSLLLLPLQVGGCVAAAGGVDEGTDPRPANGVDDHERRLCSWNIRRLGHRFDGRDKDITTTAEIIEDNCDFLAVVEVMRKSGSHPGFNDLLTELGPGWKGVATPFALPLGASTPEFYAFLYRTPLFSSCAGWDVPRFVADPMGVFDREPAYHCFSTASGGFEFDFVAGAFHARWAGGKLSERRAEVAQIAADIDGDGDGDDVFEEMAAAVPGENDLFLFGDFNLVAKDIKTVLPGYVDATDGSGSTVRSDDTRTDNLYDHLIVSPTGQTPELVGDAQVLDVIGYAPDDDTFARSISDHLPIQAIIELVQPDDDECDPDSDDSDADCEPLPRNTPSAKGDVVITEMLINPAALADAEGEWIEILNPSATRSFDLHGCVLSDDGADSDVLVGNSLSIGPGEQLVISRTGDPGFVPDVAIAGLELANGADEVVLRCSGTVIDAVRYDGSWDVRSGASLSLSIDSTDASDNDEPQNWCLATESFNGDLGTPGASNSPCP